MYNNEAATVHTHITTVYSLTDMHSQGVGVMSEMRSCCKVEHCSNSHLHVVHVDAVPAVLQILFQVFILNSTK